jgi:hypothetical protein
MDKIDPDGVKEPKAELRGGMRRLWPIYVVLGPIFALMMLASGYTFFYRESKIRDAVKREYGETLGSIGIWREWGPTNEVCLAVEIIQPNVETPVKKIVMVVGDLDGGTWGFGSEYPTYAACRAKFDRG